MQGNSEAAAGRLLRVAASFNPSFRRTCAKSHPVQRIQTLELQKEKLHGAELRR
jgi:hypothetical protein